MLRKRPMDFSKLGPESGNVLTWHLMGGEETIQCSLGKAVPPVPVHEFRARLARRPRSRCCRCENRPPAAFEVTAFVHLENRAGATEIAILASKRDGLENDGHLVCTQRSPACHGEIESFTPGRRLRSVQLFRCYQEPPREHSLRSRIREQNRTGVAVPRKNTVPQNRYDGKADDLLTADQIRSKN